MTISLSHLGRKVAAKLELLQRDGHGVGAEEQDEGHERQIRDKLAGASHQLAAVFQTLFLAELTPVESCHIHLREHGRKVMGRVRTNARPIHKTEIKTQSTFIITPFRVARDSPRLTEKREPFKHASQKSVGLRPLAQVRSIVLLCFKNRERGTYTKESRRIIEHRNYNTEEH